MSTRIQYILPATELLPAKAFAEVEEPLLYRLDLPGGTSKARALIEVVEVPFVRMPPEHMRLRGAVRGAEKFLDLRVEEQEGAWEPGGIFYVAYSGRGEAPSGHGHFEFAKDFELDEFGNCSVPGHIAIDTLRRKLLHYLRLNRNLTRRQSEWGHLTLFDEVVCHPI